MRQCWRAARNRQAAGSAIARARVCGRKSDVRQHSRMCDNLPMPENQHLEYDEVLDALQRASASADPADCHGLLCGLICANGFADQKTWVAEIFDDFNPRDIFQNQAFKLLQQLYELSLIKLNSPDLEFELLLPGDNAPLAERTESLGSWCSGFLSGMGLGGLDQARLSDDVKELLEDISHISNIDFESEDTDEQEHVAFEEVVEYIRVGVLYIHEELQPGQAPTQIQ